jgi:hypothetical protein
MSMIPGSISWMACGSAKLPPRLAVDGDFRKPTPVSAETDVAGSTVFLPRLPCLPMPLAVSTTGTFRKSSPVFARADVVASDVFLPCLAELPPPLVLPITGSFRKPSPTWADVLPELRSALGHRHPLVDRDVILVPEDWGAHGVIRYLRSEDLCHAVSGFFFTG